MSNKKSNVNIKKHAVEDSALIKLNTGLFINNIAREMKEGGYTAIDQITKNRAYIQMRNDYAGEIIRIMEELKLTTSLLQNVSEESDQSTIAALPENIINYYNGIYLDLVHQIKDKLVKLIGLLLEEPEALQDSKKTEASDITLPKFIVKHQQILKEIGIYEYLNTWETGEISLVLKRRTNHHHFRSRLKFNQDYQNMQLSRRLLGDVSSKYLSEYGKLEITKLKNESLINLKIDTFNRQESTTRIIEENINDISDKLLIYFKIPFIPKITAQIIAQYTEFLSTFTVKNMTDINKIPETLKQLVEETIEFSKTYLGNNLVSVYLVGSVPRGEFIPGSSDINLFFITGDEMIYTSKRDHILPISITVMTKGAFLSDIHKKERFICWSDGLLLLGDQLLQSNEKFPKPGTLLCLLLNRGVVEKLQDIQREIKSLCKPSEDVIRHYSLKLSKTILDFDFGIAMANKPFYTASRKAKILYVKEQFGEYPRTLIPEQVYLGKNINPKDMSIFIDSLLPKISESYEHLLEVEANIQNIQK